MSDSHLKIALTLIINEEPDLDKKLNMLTEIGVTTSSIQLFGISEQLRESLCCTKVEKIGADNLQCRGQRQRKRGCGYAVGNKNNGES